MKNTKCVFWCNMLVTWCSVSGLSTIKRKTILPERHPITRAPTLDDYIINSQVLYR